MATKIVLMNTAIECIVWEIWPIKNFYRPSSFLLRLNSTKSYRLLLLLFYQYQAQSYNVSSIFTHVRIYCIPNTYVYTRVHTGYVHTYAGLTDMNSASHHLSRITKTSYSNPLPFCGQSNLSVFLWNRNMLKIKQTSFGWKEKSFKFTYIGTV